MGVRPRGETVLQKKTLVAAERKRPDVARRRDQWMKYRDLIDPCADLIDETWTKTNMTPLFGWVPIGERLPGEAPHGHWQTMTLVAAPGTIVSMRDGFSTVPSTASASSSMSTTFASRHSSLVTSSSWTTSARTRARPFDAPYAPLAQGSSSCPKYSPDLNPIEQLFAKIELGSETPRNAPSRPSAAHWAISCATSAPPNAQTTSEMPDIPNLISSRLVANASSSSTS